RFETIIYPEVGPAIAQASAEGRVEGFYVGLELWGDNLLTGCGPGLWRPATGRELESHNLYGQIVGEMGTIGAVTFLALMLCSWFSVRKSRKAYSRACWHRDSIYYLAVAIQIAFLLMLVEGAFGHSLFRYNWLWFGSFLMLAGQYVDRRAA